jgi:hypothetical protein
VTRALCVAVVLALGCSDPAPPGPTSSGVNPEGVRVTVARREIVVHCALDCPALQGELTRLTNDCLSDPSSGPHHVAIAGAVLTLGCCQETTVAYDRGCGHEGLAGCLSSWASQCEGVLPNVPTPSDDDRGVSGSRGASH